MRRDLDPSSTNDGNISLFLLKEQHISEHYLQWMNDPEIQQYLESRHSEHNMDSLRSFVNSCLDDPDILMLGIRDIETEKHIGNIKIGPINCHYLTGEIGLLVGDRSFWGKGVATSAIRAVCRIMANELDLVKATAGAYESNKGSIRAFEKAGFDVEGVRPAQVLLNGKRESLVLMGKIL